MVPPGASRPVPQVRTVRRRQCGPRTAAWQRHCTHQRSRGADETVRLFELPVGASGQREHKRLAAAHVRVRRVHRELGRGGRCRRAQQRQHGPQCPTHVRRTDNRRRDVTSVTLRDPLSYMYRETGVVVTFPTKPVAMSSLRFLRDDALLHDVTFSFSDGEVRGAHRCVLAYQSPAMWKTRRLRRLHQRLGSISAGRPCSRLPQALASLGLLVVWAALAAPHRPCFPHRSPVFRAMFDLNSPLQAARFIPLAEKSSSEFDLLLDYCYSCDAKLVTSQTAAQLLMLAEEYQVLKLKAECEEWLIEHVDPHTCVDCLLYAQQYRCDALEAASKRMLVKEFEAIALTESLARLPAQLLAEVPGLTLRPSPNPIPDPTRAWSKP